MLVLIASLTAKSGAEAELRSALDTLVAATREEQGCLVYDLHVDDADAKRFVLYERWESDEAWNAHMASAHIKAFGAKQETMLESGSMQSLRPLDLASA